MKLLPSTRIGKAAAWLGLSALAVLILLIVFGKALEALPAALVQAVSTAAVLASISGAFLALRAMGKPQDRSPLLTLALLSGFLVAALVLGLIAMDLFMR